MARCIYATVFGLALSLSPSADAQSHSDSDTAFLKTARVNIGIQFVDKIGRPYRNYEFYVSDGTYTANQFVDGGVVTFVEERPLTRDILDEVRSAIQDEIGRTALVPGRHDKSVVLTLSYSGKHGQLYFRKPTSLAKLASSDSKIAIVCKKYFKLSAKGNEEIE